MPRVTSTGYLTCRSDRSSRMEPSTETPRLPAMTMKMICGAWFSIGSFGAIGGSRTRTSGMLLSLSSRRARWYRLLNSPCSVCAVDLASCRRPCSMTRGGIRCRSCEAVSMSLASWACCVTITERSTPNARGIATNSNSLTSSFTRLTSGQSSR